MAETFMLGDVTRIVEGHQPMIGDGIINDGPGLLLIVEKFPWANTLDVTGESRRRSRYCARARGVDIDPRYSAPRPSSKLSIDNLQSSDVHWCVLVIIVLFAVPV